MTGSSRTHCMRWSAQRRAAAGAIIQRLILCRFPPMGSAGSLISRPSYTKDPTSSAQRRFAWSMWWVVRSTGRDARRDVGGMDLRRPCDVAREAVDLSRPSARVRTCIRREGLSEARFTPSPRTSWASSGWGRIRVEPVRTYFDSRPLTRQDREFDRGRLHRTYRARPPWLSMDCGAQRRSHPLNPESLAMVQIPVSSQPGGLPAGTINAILQDPDGTLWFGTDSDGLFPRGQRWAPPLAVPSVRKGRVSNDGKSAPKGSPRSFR